MMRSIRSEGARGSRLHGILGALLVAFLLAGCGGDDRVGSAPADDAAIEEAAPDQGQSPQDAPAADREVITTATARVEVRGVGEAIDDVVTQVEGSGGRVESRWEQVDDDGRLGTAALTLRVPAEELAQILGGLDELGVVEELSQQAEDVTGVAQDLDARIEALGTSVDRLVEIMEQAETSEELLEAESTLSERQGELESMLAQRDALSDQVEMSTLDLELVDGRATAVRADGFLGGLQSGWNGLVTAADGVLVLAGLLVPWIPVLVIMAFVGGWSLRRARSRRDARSQVRGDARADGAEPGGGLSDQTDAREAHAPVGDPGRSS